MLFYIIGPPADASRVCDLLHEAIPQSAINDCAAKHAIVMHAGGDRLTFPKNMTYALQEGESVFINIESTDVPDEAYLCFSAYFNMSSDVDMTLAHAVCAALECAPADALAKLKDAGKALQERQKPTWMKQT